MIKAKNNSDVPIRIGIIGTGRFGVNHLISFRQLEKYGNVKLVAMADIDPEKCKKYSKEFKISAYQDYKEMLSKEDLTAVSVVTPDHLHGDIALEALKLGLHVFVEKPLEICSRKSAEIVKLAEEKDLLLQVDFHKRYDPYHLDMKQITKTDKIGKFLYGYCYMENRITVPKDWFPHWVNNSSPAWFLGSNFIDLLGWIMDSKAVSVYARGQKEKLLSKGIDTYDSIQAVVTYDNGAVITYHTSWVLPEQFPSIVNQGFRLIGTEGIAEVDTQDRGMESCFTSEPVMKTHNSGFIYTIQKQDGSTQYTGYGIESIQHFAENVLFLKQGGTLDDLKGKYPSGKEALEVTRIIEAIHHSIETNQVVELNPEEIKEVEETYV